MGASPGQCAEGTQTVELDDLEDKTKKENYMPHRTGFTLSLLLFVIGMGMLILSGFVPQEPWRWRLLTWGLAAWGISTALPF